MLLPAIGRRPSARAAVREATPNATAKSMLRIDIAISPIGWYYRARPRCRSRQHFAALMNRGSVDRMNYWCVVAPLLDRIGRRENTVVIRAGLSYQPDSFALGLRDKLD